MILLHIPFRASKTTVVYSFKVSQEIQLSLQNTVLCARPHNSLQALMWPYRALLLLLYDIATNPMQTWCNYCVQP